MLCGSLDGRGVWGRMDTWICMTQSLRRSLETVPTLFIGCESESRCRVRLFATPWTIQSEEFSRPECWSGAPFPSPGHLPNSGIKPRSPELQVDSLWADPQGKLYKTKFFLNKTQMRQINRKMIGLNLTISVAIINVKSLNTPNQGVENNKTKQKTRSHSSAQLHKVKHDGHTGIAAHIHAAAAWVCKHSKNSFRRSHHSPLFHGARVLLLKPDSCPLPLLPSPLSLTRAGLPGAFPPE